MCTSPLGGDLSSGSFTYVQLVSIIYKCVCTSPLGGSGRDPSSSGSFTYYMHSPIICTSIDTSKLVLTYIRYLVRYLATKVLFSLRFLRDLATNVLKHGIECLQRVLQCNCIGMNSIICDLTCDLTSIRSLMVTWHA